MNIIQHKHIGSLAITACLTIACLTFTMGETFAQKKKKGHNRRPGAGERGRARGIDFEELGAAKDKVAAHNRLTFGGAGYYTDKDRELRTAHIKTYSLIRRSLVEDRVSEDLGRKATAELLTIGEQAKEARGDATQLNEDDAEKTASSIHKLAIRIGEARSNEVDGDILTPRINNRQVSMEELYIYLVDSKTASKGEAASLRRHLDRLEKKEEASKKDGKVSDRDREKLVEEAAEVFKSFAKAIRS